jgi:hypothetical protein
LTTELLPLERQKKMAQTKQLRLVLRRADGTQSGTLIGLKNVLAQIESEQIRERPVVLFV